jgi:rSAM/selenodomain-associated transferase 2
VLLSIIIPTLNEEKALPVTLTGLLSAFSASEIIVVDGGSRDRTRAIVDSFIDNRICWVDSERGRGTQMNAGSSIATGDVLLFLHADTRLPENYGELIEEALADSRTVGGNFRIRFEPRGPVADFYTRCYNLRSRLKVFYGDSAIFVRRSAFTEIGGFRQARIMEDLELVRRLRRTGKLTTVWKAEVVSSARRFTSARSGLKALVQWTWLHILYYSGAGQEALDRRYPDVR